MKVLVNFFFSFAYLSVSTYQQYVGGLLMLLHRILHGPSQVTTKVRPHTQLVCMGHGP